MEGVTGKSLSDDARKCLGIFPDHRHLWIERMREKLLYFAEEKGPGRAIRKWRPILAEKLFDETENLMLTAGCGFHSQRVPRANDCHGRTPPRALHLSETHLQDDAQELPSGILMLKGVDVEQQSAIRGSDIGNLFASQCASSERMHGLSINGFKSGKVRR